ncbi:MAG: hypothetical protein M3275_04505 [Thermoproteota archaeon]|nr:hypothetical protein [Thermoproteota archaeon]
MKGKNNTNTVKGALLSRVMLASGVPAMMFLVLVSASPFSSILSLQQQKAEATSLSSSSFGLGDGRIPPAFIIVDGKASRLQLENDPLGGEDTIADLLREQYRLVSALAY